MREMVTRGHEAVYVGFLQNVHNAMDCKVYSVYDLSILPPPISQPDHYP